MATVTEESARQDCLPGSREADSAVQRVTAYFQDLGLPLEDAARAAGQIVREIHGEQEKTRESNGCGWGPQTQNSAFGEPRCAARYGCEQRRAWLTPPDATARRNEPRNPLTVDELDGCTGRAMDRAMVHVDDWLGQLTASCPDPHDDLAAQLKWHLRPVLQQHPESFLRTRDLPDDVHRAIREAARPILPPSIPAVMPAQSFGDLPRLGHRIVAYGGLIRYRLANLLWRMWR